MAKTGGELLRVIMFELATLILEKLRDVAYDENLLELSLEINALDINLDNLLVFHLKAVTCIGSLQSEILFVDALHVLYVC
jgi:hypothetical protein